MSAATYALNFNGGLLQRGFWLYVWEITAPDGITLYYVGRTGDSSSTNAQSPFNRMGQHLGFAAASNMLRQHLQGKGITAEKCDFRFVAYGTIMEEAATQAEHRKLRDVTAALEKALAVTFKDSGYEVLNIVKCRKKPDQNLWEQVHKAFAAYFPKLNQPPSKRKVKA
jgi:hypothetical protein